VHDSAGREDKGLKKRNAVGMAILVWAVSGCSDPFSEFLQDVPLEPTTVELKDYRTAVLQEQTAFDIVGERTVRVDQTGSWDYLFVSSESGTPQLAPFTAVSGLFSEAGLQHVDETFEGLRNAPESGYVTDEPTAVSEGDVLAAISRRDPGISGRCRYYAKIEILEIDESAGTIQFMHLINPNCEDRVLVPGQHGEL
jgi:hypothetical protein